MNVNPMRIPAGCASVPALRFTTPGEAVAAFVAAAKSGSTPSLVEIPGEDDRDLVDSGDAVLVEEILAIFVGAYEQEHSLLSDLGEDTVKAVSRLEAFDPGKGWTAFPGR
jgi:hypothetical protein